MFLIIQEGLIWWLQNDFHYIFQIQYSFEFIPEPAKDYWSDDVESYLGLCNLGVRLSIPPPCSQVSNLT